MGPQSEGLGSNSGSATSLFVDPGALVFSYMKGNSSMCLRDVLWLPVCPGAALPPLEECWVGGEGGPEREGGALRDSEDSAPAPLSSELPGGGGI